MKNKLPLALSLSFLAACGGGSSGGDAALPAPSSGTTTILRTFPDGSGIARTEIPENRTTFVANVIAPNIRNFNPSSGTFGAGAQNPSTSTQYTLAGTNKYGNFYTGQTSVNGITVDVLIYEDQSGYVEAGIVRGAGTSAAYAGGERVSNMPGGVYEYAGTNIFSTRDGSAGESGNFSMNVDFDNRRASILGRTTNTLIEGSEISINNQNGTFSGDNLTLTLSNGVTSGAKIDGNFHGNGAVGLTGIYVDSAENPTVTGVIAGTRQP